MKKIELHIDKDIYTVVRHKVKKIILNKKEAFLDIKLTESICKPKDLSNPLKSLGLPNNMSSCEVTGLRINKLRMILTQY